MRIAGLYSQDGAALKEFCDHWRGVAAESDGGAVRLRLWPDDVPLVAVAAIEGGNPPVQWAQGADGSLAVLDGEVYGASDGRAAGPGEGQDAVAILARYAAKGPDGMAAVNGGAACVILDASNRSLMLFRDRLGQVPIFHAERPEGMYWGTDLPSLLALGIPGTLDLNALDYFVARGFVAAPWTLVTGIRKIPPAHFLRRSMGGPGETRRYWSVTGQPKLNLSPAESAEQLGVLIEQSIRRRYTKGTRTGVLLSSGVDSALIAGCLASRVGADIDTFTFRYGAYDGEYNELDVARETAAHFGLQHHALDYGPEDIADNFERMVRDYGEPFMWGIHTSKLSGVAANGIQTLLTGIAPDGWFLSSVEDKMMLFRRFPPLQWAAGATVPALRVLRPKLARDAETFLSWCRAKVPNSAIMRVMPDAYRRRVYTDPTLVDSGQRAATELTESMDRDVVAESPRDRFTFLQQRLFFAECLLFWNQAWARADSLALRHPYTDNDVQEFVLRLPRRDTNKDVLRRYAATVLPRDKAYAPKIYQTLPLDQWFRGPLQGFVRDQLSSSRLSRQGLFEPRAIQQLIDDHATGRATHTWRLLAILTVTVWQDIVLKGREGVVPRLSGREVHEHRAEARAGRSGDA